MTAPTAPLRLFQIAYSPETLRAEPGFEVLDNTANPRPDWYEYGPVRRFLIDSLLNETLDEQAFYGFFSPKFRAKTGWGPADVAAQVARHGAQADVLLFSAHPNQIGFFVNVFEQSELFHPGLLALSQQWLARAGMDVPLKLLLMDARQMVFCNYFVARPAFWRAWLALGENLYALCEGEPSPLQQKLTAPTDYEGGTQMKIFVMERIASLLLAVRPHWRSVAADPYEHGIWPNEQLEREPTDVVVSCALKHALRDTGWPQYGEAFSQVRRKVMGRKAAP